jgi:hypothetical protein
MCLLFDLPYLCSMRTLRIILVGFILIVASLSSLDASAQCSMCTLNADNSVQNGNTEGKGLNNGILYLLAAPYLAIAGVGFLWYKKYRRKNVTMNIKDSKINLN